MIMMKIGAIQSSFWPIFIFIFILILLKGLVLDRFGHSSFILLDHW